MKKIVGILVVMALASLTGCATEGYVRSQVDPLAERISKLHDQAEQLAKELEELQKETQKKK